MIDIRHAPHHDDLATTMEEVLTDAVPWVEKVTGLPLSRVRIDIVDVDGFATAYSAFVRRQIERDIAGLDLTSWYQKKVPALVYTAGVMVRKGWIYEPALVATSNGQPSTLVLPEVPAPRGLGEEPDLLCELLVRALAQQAQVLAGDGDVVPAPEWPTLSHSGHPVVLLSEGHAQWTSSLVTPKILGHPVDTTPLRQHQPLSRRILDHVLDPGAGRRRTRAVALVDQAVNAKGLTAFNRVWNTPGLAPTRDEFRNPQRWIDRLPA